MGFIHAFMGMDWRTVFHDRSRMENLSGQTGNHFMDDVCAGNPSGDSLGAVWCGTAMVYAIIYTSHDLCYGNYSDGIYHRVHSKYPDGTGDLGLFSFARKHFGTDLFAILYCLVHRFGFGDCHVRLDAVCGRGWRKTTIHILKTE